MSGKIARRIVVLKTGLFPDGLTLERAVKVLEREYVVSRFEVNDRQLDDPEWDEIVAEILVSDQIVSI